MANQVAKVPFNGTPEQEKKLHELIESERGRKGFLMPVLEEAQNIYGYLPEEVLKIISEELQVSMAKIYGIVTFYSFFSLNPKGEVAMSICLGTACYVKGSGDIFEKLKNTLKIESGGCTPDGKFSLDDCRCVGACGLAPVLLVNDEVYGRLTTKEVDGILEKYGFNAADYE